MTEASRLRLIIDAPRALEAALLERVAELRCTDPLAPIDVLVGGVLQRPYLQRRIADTSAGLLNVRFSTLGELGLRLGEPTLAVSSQRPLPAIAQRTFVAEVARGSTGYFEPVARTPGFAEAVRRLLRELRQEGISPATLAQHGEHVAESPVKAAAVVDLWERYLAAKGDAYDSEDALAVADASRFDGIELLITGIWSLGANGRHLIEQIAASTTVSIFLPSVGSEADLVHEQLRLWARGLGATEERAVEEDSPGELAALQRHLFAPAAPVEPDGSVELVSAPDPLTETREVARTCLAWATAGIPWRSMAVAYRQAEIYRPLVEAVFAEAGIPVYLDDGPSLAERPVGRRILGLLDLIDSPLRRRDVIAFLSDGRMPKATRDRFGGAPAARWDSASRRAGVVEGLEQWRQRLTLLGEAERTAAQEDGAPSWLMRRVEDCESLLAFIENLAADLAGHPHRASWTESLAYVRELLGTYVRDSEGVVGYLDSLKELDRLLPEVAFSRFLEVVRAEVRALKAGDVDGGQQGAFGRRGVNVLDVNQLRNLRFRAVAVLGLTERAFPPPPRQDPLLLDEERERLNGAGGWTLPLRARGGDPEPLQFALAVHAANERLLLSTRRAQEAGGRAQLPSSFFRLAVSALEGRRVRVDEMDELTRVRRLPAGRLGAGGLDRPLTLVERDRTLLESDPSLGRAVLERLEPRAGRADALRRARWSTRMLTPFDGTFASDAALDALERSLAEGRPLSATALETYAACPYRFFLSSVLRARPLDEPEALLRMAAVERGKLVHEVLRRFVQGLDSDRLDPAARGALLEGLLSVAEEALGRAEAAGLTGMPLLWRGDRQEILDDVAAWLDQELAEPGPYESRALEVAFGGRWNGDEEDPLARDEPFEVRVGDRTLRLSGRIDRLDYGSSSYRVIDYKTGKGAGLKDDLAGGRALQLPLYLLVGGWLLGLDTRHGEAAYHVVSRRGDFRRVLFTGEKLAEREEALNQILARIVEGIAGGDFHPEPGDHCRYCDYDSLCDVGRRRIIERKRSDPRVESFRAMAEL